MHYRYVVRTQSKVWHLPTLATAFEAGILSGAMFRITRYAKGVAVSEFLGSPDAGLFCVRPPYLA